MVRMANAGAQVMNWCRWASERHRDRRHDIEGGDTLLSNPMPAYRNLMTSDLAKKQDLLKGLTPVAADGERLHRLVAPAHRGVSAAKPSVEDIMLSVGS
jgi:hypothetical protein